MKQYKRTCNSKKYNFWQKTFTILEDSCKDSKKIWDKWKECTNNFDSNLGSKITGDEWYNYFTKLYSSQTENSTRDINQQSGPPCPELNRPFTITELTEEIKK